MDWVLQPMETFDTIFTGATTSHITRRSTTASSGLRQAAFHFPEPGTMVPLVRTLVGSRVSSSSRTIIDDAFCASKDVIHDMMKVRRMMKTESVLLNARNR